MKSKNIMGFLLMGLALLAIIFAIITFSLDDGSWVSSKSYGGDAYTGIQNAGAGAANNIQDLICAVKTIGGLGFLLTGFVLFVVGVTNCGLLDKILAPKPKVAPMAPPAPAPVGFDPATGAPVFPQPAPVPAPAPAPAPAPVGGFDPMTGAPINNQ